MKFKKTLLSIIAGISLAIPSARPAVIEVPAGAYLDPYVNSAQSGDTLNTLGNVYVGDEYITKDLTFQLGGNIYGNSFIIGESANVVLTGVKSFRALNFYNPILVQDQSSLTIKKIASSDDINFNSSANLTFIDSYMFGGTISLENLAGNININRNVFYGGANMIDISGTNTWESGLNSKLTIANNTMWGATTAIKVDNALERIDTLIINNSLAYNKTNVIGADKLGEALVSNNNFYDTNSTLGLVSFANQGIYTTSQTTTNFNYDPRYANTNDFQLQPNSELWGRGLYVNDVTTWFANPNSTWIGNNGNGMPLEAVPEPSSSLLLLAGGLTIYGLRKEQEKKRK